MAKAKTSSSILNNEYKAKIECGLTDQQWFGLSRVERAARIAYIYGRDMVDGMMQFDAIEESKAKSKDKGKR